MKNKLDLTPIHKVITTAVYLNGRFACFQAAVRTSEEGKIIVSGKTEEEAKANLEVAYGDWLSEPRF